MLFDLNPGTGASSPANFLVFGDRLLFTASNGFDRTANPAAVGTELWSISLAQLGASEAEQIGTGCAGVSGIPQIGTTGGWPYIGNAAFGATLANGAPSMPCALWLSPARSDFAFGPCTFHPSLALFVSALLGTTATGTCTAGLAIPNNPAIVGANVWMQWIVLDNAGAYGPGLASFSPGLRVRVGGS